MLPSTGRRSVAHGIPLQLESTFITDKVIQTSEKLDDRSQVVNSCFTACALSSRAVHPDELDRWNNQPQDSSRLSFTRGGYRSAPGWSEELDDLKRSLLHVSCTVDICHF